MKLIDADALRKPIYAEEDNITGSGMTYAEMDGYNAGIDAAWSRIDNAPTVDAVEVIRCKDCKYYIPRIKVPTDSGVFTVKICSRISIGITNPEWYCSYGERKGE